MQTQIKKKKKLLIIIFFFHFSFCVDFIGSLLSILFPSIPPSSKKKKKIIKTKKKKTKIKI